jgi:hypothetical protein
MEKESVKRDQRCSDRDHQAAEKRRSGEANMI